jgi:hypothetical protein
MNAPMVNLCGAEFFAIGFRDGLCAGNAGDPAMILTMIVLAIRAKRRARRAGEGAQ